MCPIGTKTLLAGIKPFTLLAQNYLPVRTVTETLLTGTETFTYWYKDWAALREPGISY